MKKYTFLLTAVVLVFTVYGCSSQPLSQPSGDGPNSQDPSNNPSHQLSQLQTKGQFVVALHDEKPKDGNIQEVELTVSSVEINQDGSSWQTISKGETIFDLLKLIDGAEVVLAHATLDAGTYNQIRLHLGANPRVLVDGSWEPLRIPSGFETGVKLSGLFNIRPGVITRLVLDLDPNESIHFVPGQSQWFLKPSIEIEAIYTGIETPTGDFQATGGTTTVNPGTGGTITLDDGATLEVPPGAVEQNTEVTVERIPSESPIYFFSPIGQTFATPLLFTVSYADLEIPPGRTPQDIMFLLDGAPAPVTVNTVNKTITAEIDHFSMGIEIVDGDIFVTFDDGPKSENTILSRMLDTLKNKSEKATFFHVGELIDASPELLTRALKEGHWVGNHSYNHATFSFADGTEEEIRAEIEKTNTSITNVVIRVIRELVDAGTWETTPYKVREYLVRLYVRSGTPLFRPPGGRVDCTFRGKYNLDALYCGGIMDRWHAEEFFDLDWLFNSPMALAVYSLNMGIFNWDEDPKDWSLDSQQKPASDLVEVVKNLDISTGEIVLMHERNITANALTDILDNLKSRDFNLKRLDAWPPDGANPLNPTLEIAQNILAMEGPQPPGVVTVDDRDAGFTRENTLPEYDRFWLESSVGWPISKPHMYYVWNNGPDSKGGLGTAVVQNAGRWTASIQTIGFYKIEAFVPSQHADTKSADYRVRHRDGVEVCRVDQSAYFDKWVDLGTYRMQGTADDRVWLSDLTQERDSTVQIGYDAMRFTLVGETEKRRGDNCTDWFKAE